MSDKKNKETKTREKSKVSASEAAELAEAAARAALERSNAAKEAVDAAAEAEYEAAKKHMQEISSEPVTPSGSFTDKYKQNQIFRREMEEPEFFLRKKERAPPRPVLSQDEVQEVSRKVQIPADQTPKYIPQHILSPQFGGVSNYERGIDEVREEILQKLQLLRNDPDANSFYIKQAEEDLKTLDYLYQNFHIGMNVFRTAKGGREKLRD